MLSLMGLFYTHFSETLKHMVRELVRMSASIWRRGDVNSILHLLPFYALFL